MEFTIREKNPGPQVNIKKNDQEVMASGQPQTEAQIKMAQGKAEPKK